MITCKGFILRHLEMKDLPAYYESKNDQQLLPFLLKIPKNLEEARKELKIKIADYKKKKPFGETFAIEVNGEFAGYIDIHNLNLKNQGYKCEIGYCVHPKFRGRGLATKAVKLVTNYAFKKYKLKRISAMGRLKNKASARVLEKAGYKLEGILRKNKCINGEYYDDFLYARVK